MHTIADGTPRLQSHEPGATPPDDLVQDSVTAIASLPAVTSILEVICRTTGMGFAAVARVTTDRWIACSVHDEIAFGLAPGGELEVGTTLCSQIHATRELVVIDEVAKDRTYGAHPTPARYGFQSYISVPIVLRDGSFFGTLCAIDPKPARVNTPQIVAMFRLFASMIAGQLSVSSELQERTAERDTLWTISRDLFVVVAADGTIRRANPAWQFELGHDQAGLKGRPLAGFVHPEDRPEVERLYYSVLAGAPAARLEARIRSHDGSWRLFSWSVVELNGDFHASGRDITEERRNEEALRQAHKMEAVGQLTGGIAHDFNNLVAGISGSLEMVERRLVSGEIDALPQFIEAAQRGARRAALLTQRLLAFSRRQTLDPRPVDLNRLVAGMAELIERFIGAAITFDAPQVPGLWPALIDENQLETALLNLCINARDAMPEGGRLSIGAANLKLLGDEAASLSLPPGDYVQLGVSDTGHGMSEDVLTKAIEPFFTTKPLGKGTGLGLSMTYGFMKQSGGQLRIVSEPGRCTTVSLYLPRASDEETVRDEAPAEALAGATGETVLVVDDEPTIRLFVTEMLQDAGYTTMEASDAGIAFEVLQSNARIDLLLTDVGLPGGMNGRQLADAARILRPGLKVLFITGFADQAVLTHRDLEPGMQVLAKPFTLDSISDKVREMIAG